MIYELLVLFIDEVNSDASLQFPETFYFQKPKELKRFSRVCFFMDGGLYD